MNERINEPTNKPYGARDGDERKNNGNMGDSESKGTLKVVTVRPCRGAARSLPERTPPGLSSIGGGR